MKYFNLSFILFGFFFHSANAQFNFQYFDGADTLAYNSILIEIDSNSSDVWQIGKPQKVIFNTAATQPNAIVTDTINYYPSSDTSRFIAKIRKNFPTWGIFAVQWKQKLDMDTSFDGGIIEYSIDSGSTWVNVFNNPYVYNFYGFLPANKDTLTGGEFAFSGTDTLWRDVWLCFDYSWMQLYQLNDTLLFRFSIVSDSINNNKEGWVIDNMTAHTTIVHTIKEVAQDKYLNVFPNPANDIVNIQIEKLMQYHIIEQMDLIDALGRVVDSWQNIPTKFWFDTHKYSEGSYFLKVQTNVKSETVPLVITKH